MSRKNLILLRILLIAIMVLQPAVSAYAMATMDHNPGGAVPQAMHEHEMDHGAMHQAMNEDASPAAMENCCASNAACLMATCPMSACSVALFMNPISALKIEITLVIPTYQLSWAGILLPTEIRPPRSLLG